MWGSFKTIVAQYCTYNQAETEQKDVDDDDLEGWVIVDKSGKEVKKGSFEAELLDSPKRVAEFYLNSLPLLDISNTSSAQSTPQLSPSRIEEGWLIAPPPCFTLNCPSVLEISPFEDLLIEHPSMSVYEQIPILALHDDKAGDDVNMILEQTRIEMESQPRDTSLPPTFNKAGTKKGMVRSKTSYDLAGMLNQIENVKPGQQAKWENEQFKLCPSYMTRQNRVHRYQSRKHQNQKKKSLAKPFAEKGRNSF